MAIRQPLHIAVAGCGTAGMAAAILLARDGHRVTLLERFDEPSPIGSGLMLQPTGLAVLQHMGIDAAAERDGQRIRRIQGWADGRIVLNVDYRFLGRPDAYAIGIHRATLFAILHEAVQAEHVPIHTGRSVLSAETSRRGVRLMLAGGGVEGPFDLVVDALGTRRPLAPRCGRDLAYGALWANVGWAGSFDAAALSQRPPHPQASA